jgi:hypothetical protein
LSRRSADAFADDEIDYGAVCGLPEKDIAVAERDTTAHCRAIRPEDNTPDTSNRRV